MKVKQNCHKKQVHTHSAVQKKTALKYFHPNFEGAAQCTLHTSRRPQQMHDTNMIIDRWILQIFLLFVLIVLIFYYLFYFI